MREHIVGLMIDYRDDVTGKFVRKRIDGSAFSIREGVCYFTSNEEDFSIDIADIVQVYTY